MQLLNNNTFDLRSARALTLGSGCKIVFIRRQNGKITPALMLTGIESIGNKISTLCGSKAEGRVGIITSEIIKDNENNPIINTHFKDNYIQIGPISSESSQGTDQETDWMTIDLNTDKIVYPRVFIRSLNIKTDSNSLVLKYQDYNNNTNNQNQNNIYKILKPYEDYSILTRSLQDEYVMTIDNNIIIKQGVRKKGYGGIENRKLVANYTISNADTAIYLDALEVAKQNAEPKVSYEVKPNIFNSKYCATIYNKIGNIIRINDTDLKFQNVRGYISGLTLDLDSPQNDVIDVKNYKSKFEDLFSTITAQTQQMKKNSHTLEMVTSAFTSTGDISADVLQSSIFKVDLNYAFDNGKLTIDENNGIWGMSDNGVVAFRGGGIFTSTERDIEGNWKWNTGITPEGINASLITTGQLDTNLIKIYAGDHLRFQMNGDGIFAYKSWLNDVQINQDNGTRIHPKGQIQQGEQYVEAASSLDGKQYVRFNEDGLALIAKRGAMVLNSAKTEYISVLNDTIIQAHPQLAELDEIRRVEVSWDGFILRNWLNEKVFYADPQTGNLTLKGRIQADEGRIGTWNFDNNKLWADSAMDPETKIYTTFVALNAGGLTGPDEDGHWDPMKKGSGEFYKDKNGHDLYLDTHNYCFWAGNIDPETANFSIKKDGTIKASSGQIGGWILDGTFFYNPKSLVMAPGGVSSNQTISYSINDLKEDGTSNGKTTKTISLDGLVLWVPSSSWRNTTNVNITDSLGNSARNISPPTLSINANGDLTASTVNGWGKTYFNNNWIVTGWGSSSLSLVQPSTGNTHRVNFDSLSNASCSVSITGTKLDGDTKTIYLSITVSTATRSRTWNTSISTQVVYKTGGDNG